MGDTEKTVKLHGMWASPWVRRVKIGLEIKGISYDYIEEDLKNKSQLLLQYNPVKKLVPVLVHDGRPIPESLVILEYIDEIWTDSPKLFPQDPYLRSKFRFWADFINLQVFEKLRDVVKIPNDQEEERVIKEILENMGKLEANVKDLYAPSDGKSMGILDILMVTLLPIINGVEEVINIKFIQPEKYPLAFSWMKSRDEIQVVQETAPNHENLVKFLRKLREYFRSIAV